jgi:hypothetical protein
MGGWGCLSASGVLPKGLTVIPNQLECPESRCQPRSEAALEARGCGWHQASESFGRQKGVTYV